MTTATALLEHLEIFQESAGGGSALRDAILTLAVQGKLVPQEPGAESGATLIERIAERRKELVESKEATRLRKLPAIRASERPFEVPESWSWARLDEVSSYIQRGRSPKYVEDSEIPVVSQKCIQWDGFDISPARFIDPNTLDKYGPERFLRSGDLLWNSTGTGTVGRVNVYQQEYVPYERVVADSHVTVIRPLTISPWFVYLWIASPFVQSEINNMALGSTKQVELNKSTVQEHVIPVPPLEEQRRIVEQVQVLLAHCEQLDLKKQQRDSTRSRLAEASYHHLATASTAREFNISWLRITENFRSLTDTDEDVQRLQDTILDLALTGRLGTQHPSDTPAARTRSYKARMSAKSLDGTWDVPPIPPSWSWVELQSVVTSMEAGWSPQCLSSPSTGDKVWGVLRTTAVQKLDFLPYENKQLPDELDPREDYEVHEGDILVTRAGPRDRVAVSCVVPQVRPRLMLSDKIIRFRAIKGLVLPTYVAIALSGGHSKAVLEERKSGMAASQMNISQSKLRTTPVPLPPIEEQERIVDTINHLYVLCDDLRLRIRHAHAVQGKLLDALALGGGRWDGRINGHR